MPYMEKIDEILKRNINDRTFEFWLKLRETISNKCWDKPTSSTGKYHKKSDGRVPSVIEHTYEMIYCADKIISMFEGIINKDVIFLSLVLHDSYKYGLCKNCRFTEIRHGEIISETIKLNRKIFKQILTDQEIDSLIYTVKYHDGKWSPCIKTKIDSSFYTPELMFLHMLDMLSSRNCLKITEVT